MRADTTLTNNTTEALSRLLAGRSLRLAVYLHSCLPAKPACISVNNKVAAAPAAEPLNHAWLAG